MPAGKQFNQEVVVRIWRNIKKWGIVPTSHFGHASVAILGNLVPGGFQHISFWPGDYASKGNAIKKQTSSATAEPIHDKVSEMNRLTALRLEVGYCKDNGIPYPAEYDEMLAEMGKTPLSNARPGQRRLGTTDGDGLPLWSQSPEAKIYLPGIRATGRTWGLSTRRMGLWWQQFQTTKPHYQALGQQNCAGVALMGLKEGGSEAFVECPGVKIYGEPVQVEKYANLLAQEMQRMDDWTAEFDRDVAEVFKAGKMKDATPASELKDGLWSLETWKQKSHLGGLTVRSSLIRDIDDAVARFHKGDWGVRFNERYLAMADAFRAIVQHRRDKADSKRTDSLVRLGSQIVALLRNPSPAM